MKAIPIIAIVLRILMPLSLRSQNLPLIDSLTRALVGANDQARAALHQELSYQWAAFDFDSAMSHANSMNALATKLKDPVMMARSIASKGTAFDYQSRFDSAVYFYNKALEQSRDLADSLGMAKLLINLGVVHLLRGDLDEALSNLLAVEQDFRHHISDRTRSTIYINQGVIYRKTKKYVLARDKYLQALELKRAINDQSGELNVLTNLSTIYQYLEEFDKAILVSEEVLEKAKRQNNRSTILLELVNLGQIYKRLGHYKKSIALYLQAKDMLNSKMPYSTFVNVYLQLEEVYLAAEYSKESLKYIQILDTLVDVERSAEMAGNHYLLAYEFFKKFGDYEKALQYHEKALSVQMKLFDNEVLEKTTELEQVYEKTKRELEIERLSKANEINTLQINRGKQERNFLLILVGIVLIITALLYILFRQKRKSLQQREVLLKEIHHRVKNNLQIVSSLLNLQAGHLNDDAAKDAVKEGQNRVKSMALIHQKLYQNDNISGVELSDYIANLTQALFQSFGVDPGLIHVDLDVDQLRLDIDTLIPMGLVLNELVSNSLKYAFPQGKGKLMIGCRKQADNLELVVKDDGPGFKESDLINRNSYGWKMVRSLSRKLKAEIDVDNTQGTQISLQIKNFKLVA